jgi:hypothetical protein
MGSLRLGMASSGVVSVQEAGEVGGDVGVASHRGNGTDGEVPAVLAAGADGVEAGGPGGDVDPRLDPAAILVDPDDEDVVAEGGGAGHPDEGARDVPPLVESMRGAGPSPGPPERLRLRSRGIRGQFWSYRTDSDEEDHLGHIETFWHTSESDEINGIAVADDPDQVSSNFGGDGSDVDQRVDLNPELMEIDRAGGESEVGGEPSPVPPPGMTLATGSPGGSGVDALRTYGNCRDPTCWLELKQGLAGECLCGDMIGECGQPTCRAEAASLRSASCPHASLPPAGPLPKAVVYALVLPAGCSLWDERAMEAKWVVVGTPRAEGPLRITASNDSDDNPVEEPGPMIGEADKEIVIDSVGSVRGAP